MKTIGIVETRRRDDLKAYKKVYNAFLKVYKQGDRICSGLCPKGGDRFAVMISEALNTKTLWFPAQWKRYGHIARFIRNSDIAKNSDILIACVSKDRTGGTEDAIKKFIKYMGKKI